MLSPQWLLSHIQAIYLNLKPLLDSFCLTALFMLFLLYIMSVSFTYLSWFLITCLTLFLILSHFQYFIVAPKSVRLSSDIHFHIPSLKTIQPIKSPKQSCSVFFFPFLFVFLSWRPLLFLEFFMLSCHTWKSDLQKKIVFAFQAQ